MRGGDWFAPRMLFASPILDGPMPSRPGSLAVAAATDEAAAIRADMSTVDPSGPAATFDWLSRLNHRAVTTHDPDRLAAPCGVFLDHGTCQVPTLAVLHAKATVGAAEFPLTVFEHCLFLVHRTGVPLLAGIDTFVPGHRLHDELGLLVVGGAVAFRAS